jgi:hypothetical protein
MKLKDISNNLVATRTLRSGCGIFGIVDEYFAPACTCE